MQIDEARLIEVVERLCLVGVIEELGANASAAVTTLWPMLRDMYRSVEPLLLTMPLAVAVPIDPTRQTPTLGDARSRRYQSLSLAANDLGDGGWLLEIRPSGEVNRWELSEVDIPQLAGFAVVYTYDQGKETIQAGARTCAIPNLAPQASPSAFARPTFLNLQSALENYRQHVARTSQCPYLKEAWFDSNRLFWKAKPEEQMRKSLHHYLHTVMSGDAEVRPEQIVDESHPVDIKVTWQLINRLALIEIKWLGDSRKPDGTPATDYRDARALSGALQLADYLNGNRQLTPTYHTRGYLVVFDARRRGLKPGTTQIGWSDGFYYAQREIRYEPEFHRTRPDFAEPVRFFVEPVP